MKEIITTLIYISVLAIIIELVMPKSKIKKYINLAMSLLVIITIISPLVNTLNNDYLKQVLSKAVNSINYENITSDATDYKTYAGKVILENTRLALEEELTKKLKEKTKEYFELTEVEIKINEEYKIEEVLLHVQNKDETKYDVNTISGILSDIAKEYSIEENTLVIVYKGG